MISMDELMGDPDFFQEMTILRRFIQYDANGTPTTVSSFVTPKPYGCIQSGSNPETTRVSDMAQVEDVIDIVTAFRLYVNGDIAGQDRPQLIAPASADVYGNIPVPTGQMEYRSDVILWHGDTYEVVLVQDWSDYGNGFLCATARKVSRGQVAA